MEAVSLWADELRLKSPSMLLETVRRSHGHLPRDGIQRTLAHEICLIPSAERRRLFYDVFALLCTPECIDDRDGGGYTVAHMAAQYGDITILELIRKLRPGALDVPTTNEQRYPMHFAVQAGCIEAVKLIESVAPQSFARHSVENRYPLHTACYNCDVDLVKYVYERYPPAAKARVEAHPHLVDSNVVGYSCVMIAAEAGRADTVMFLLDKLPEEAIIRMPNGKMPLSVALGGRHFRVAEYLITRHPATASLRAELGSKLPLHQACLRGHAGLVRLLLSAHPAGAAAHDGDGYLAVHCAAQSGQIEAFDAVCAAQPALVTSLARVTGRTTLHFAAQDGHADIVESILRALDGAGGSVAEAEAGARALQFMATVSQDMVAVTALYSAVYRGHTGVALRLLQYAARVPGGATVLADTRNMPESQTPLHALFLRHLEEGVNGCVPVVDAALFGALRAACPDASDVKNTRGETPLDLHVQFDEFYRAFHTPAQRVVQQWLLRTHLASFPSRHHRARRDMVWACRRCDWPAWKSPPTASVRSRPGPSTHQPPHRRRRPVFVATAAGLKVEFLPSGVPSVGGTEGPPVPGTFVTLFAPRRLAVRGAAAGATAVTRKGIVINVTDKGNVLSLLWLASLDAWKHVISYL